MKTVPQSLMGGCRKFLLQSRDSSSHVLKLLHDKASASEKSPFHKHCPKGSCTLPPKQKLGWLLQAITCSFFLVPGLIWIPDYPFDERQADFNFVSLLTRPEVILLLTQVQDECNKAATMSLFNSTLAKHVSLEEFEQIQTQTFTQVSRGSVGGEHMEQPAGLSPCIRQMQQLQIYSLEMDEYEFSKERLWVGQGGICMCVSNLLGCGENGLKEP